MYANKIIHQIKSEIEKHSSIIILGHENPDGDSLGSQQALGYCLRNAYPKKEIYTPFEYKPIPNLFFLKYINSKINEEIFAKSLVIYVDLNEPKRAAYSNLKAKKIIIIDHHPITEKTVADIQYIDSQRIACAELILEIILALNWKLNLLIAEWLYLGIITDSGGLVFSKVNARTFELVNILVKQGINIPEFNHKINKMSFGAFKKFQYLVKNLKIRKKYGLFEYWPKNQKDLKVKSYREFSRFLIFFKNLQSCPILIFIVQTTMKDLINCNLRSRGNYNVGKIARMFGGGGHDNAAGIKLKSNKQVIRLIKEVEKILNYE